VVRGRLVQRHAASLRWDVCTRACAHELLDGEISKQVDAYAEVIADITRTIHEDGETPPDEENKR
jgi:hypothetical protein